MNYIFLVLKLKLKKGKIRNCLIKCLLYVIKGFLLIYINVNMKSYIFKVMGRICQIYFENQYIENTKKSFNINGYSHSFLLLLASFLIS